jgi:cytochrome c oxidase subunit 2
MYLEPTREGTFAGKCAELCGEYHSAMLFNVKVVSEDEYQQHMQDLRDRGYTGKLGADYDRNRNVPGPGAPTTTTNNE